jgi:hypothetical protein
MPSIEEKEKIFPHQKSSLPDCYENTSHRGVGLLFSTDAPLNATSNIQDQRKRKNLPTSKK